MNHFAYHSEQVHKVNVNGKSSTRRNIVHINNGKGYKELNTNGKSKRKALTKKELSCIKKGKFVPGLFNDCVQPLRPNKTSRRRKNN